jgi:site-specific recombinase XerD
MGQRYPITCGGASTVWKRVVRNAGIDDLRLHDNRHDTASKVLRKTGNLKVVSRLLNHTNIATTAKYAHVLDEEVAEALEFNAESRKKSRIDSSSIPAIPAE